MRRNSKSAGLSGSDIIIRLSSTNEPGQYAAFGISGSTQGTQMVGGDVIVAFIDDTGDANVVDYYLQSQAQVWMNISVILSGITVHRGIKAIHKSQ